MWQTSGRHDNEIHFHEFGFRRLQMKNRAVIICAAIFLLALWANGHGRFAAINVVADGETSSAPGTLPPGNIEDGMYTIVSESSRRCLEVPNSSCLTGVQLQTFDCDRDGVSNNQKFNVVSDGSGNYTVSPAHSDLCLEVASEKFVGRIPILQAACEPNKASQKWSMSQYGVNLEIRHTESKRCIDIMRAEKSNYTPINLQSCSNGTNQRWRLSKATLNTDQGIICKASPAHPEHDCSGVNDQQKQVHLGKTLTKARCEAACQVNRMVSCRWAGSK
jgi:hypothetical protein